MDRDDKYAATSEEELMLTMEKDPKDRVDRREASLHRRWMSEMQKRNEGTAERKQGGWPINYGPGDEAYCLHCGKRIMVSLCHTMEECDCQESKREQGKIGVSGSLCQEAPCSIPGLSYQHATLVHGGPYYDEGTDAAVQPCRTEDVQHHAGIASSLQALAVFSVESCAH